MHTQRARFDIFLQRGRPTLGTVRTWFDQQVRAGRLSADEARSQELAYTETVVRTEWLARVNVDGLFGEWMAGGYRTSEDVERWLALAKRCLLIDDAGCNRLRAVIVAQNAEVMR